MALIKNYASSSALTATAETPSKSQTMTATHDAKILVVYAHMYGNNINPTFNITPDAQYKFDRTIIATFSNVHTGDSIATYNSGSLPYNDSANGQYAVYYN